jgi:aryl-alcohol dehydrogenase-like predicted oxidoreductase
MHSIIQIGKSDLHVPPVGVGAWQWGEDLIWGIGRNYNRADAEAAFKASINAGLTFFDTAEMYGRGGSERVLGACAKTTDKPIVIASKFAPLPMRIGRRTVMHALDESLKRLDVSHIDLYQVHWPFPVIPIEMLMDFLADAVAAGKVRYIGVSNYSAEQMRRAHAALAKRGLPLVSNQVRYSLLHRTPEMDGVWAACRELDITLIAYSPLAQGMLSGKYNPANPPPAPRRFMPDFNKASLERIQPVIQTLTQIGDAHGGKTPAQVALNWLARQPGVLPIPGAKNARHAEANAGAIGWDMTDDEADLLNLVTLNWRK